VGKKGLEWGQIAKIMASSNGGGGGGGGGGGAGEEELKRLAELSQKLKEGERIVAPTRRPDGTLRKPIRIRAGYVPQEEVAIYQSKGALWKKEMASQVGPPGYDPEIDSKPKTKSVKRNERKKEKRLQVYFSLYFTLLAFIFSNSSLQVLVLAHGLGIQNL
jgi:hypothetical protein